MGSSNTKVRLLQGGNTLEVDSGGAINLLAGGVIQDAGVARASAITFSPAAGSANVCLVTIQVQDGNGNSVAAVHDLDVWLSDAATGIGLTATTASGAVGAGASGTDLGVLTTKKATRVLTDATGKYILSITDTAKTGFFVGASMGSKVAVSAQLITANYG